MFRSDIQNLSSIEQAHEMIETVQASSNRFILSTSFGHYSSVLLKMVSDIVPDVPVVWVDSGYHTEQTYCYCELLKERFNLNLHIFHPQRSVTHRSAIGAYAKPQDDDYDDFVDEIKLEPFRRALAQLQPDIWISGIRKEETEHRRRLGILSEGPNGIKKVSPLFNWQEADLLDYMTDNDLPFEGNYHDPAKISANQECGLHCRL